MSTQKEITEIETILTHESQLRSTEPRWVRKQRELKEATAPIVSASDRFIPQLKTASELDAAHQVLVACAKENLTNNNNNATGAQATPQSPAKTAFRQMLAEETATSATSTGSKILSFTAKAPVHNATLQDSMRLLYSGSASTTRKTALTTHAPVQRYIPQAPERVLDAPEMVDDYYLNLLDWSSDNMLAVALGRTVYLWSADSGEIKELMSTPGEAEEDNIVTSLRWMRGSSAGTHLAIGTNAGEVQLWDCARVKQLRSMKGHTGRVGSLSWHGHMVASGSKDSTVMIHDVRKQQHLTSTLQSHVQEVCGLEWSPSGAQLASGGNDNVLNVWDAQSAATGGAPRCSFTQHVAAVKALSWCPWQQNLLASGGGTADRCVKFWNTESGVCVNSIDTHSQVTSLQWSITHRELVSAHGFSNNQLSVWKYPTLEKVCDLTGHEKRILHTACSPDGSVVASAGADETLRFWSIWPTSSASPSSSIKAGAISKAESKVENSFCFSQLR